ncbi:galactose-binding domain-containing protein [Agromyces ramosus]|uniref:F5/8 type C domain-containing protein n=1 Tax=Agromyces ramosus TaxID=33879 RepID=A0ABU0R7D6_9MICO|nr:discoidin domain-containing protein [Agromyces ramosus]MDQ0893990.1 hypothetical protein [Agromyces ramosus]
MAALVGGFFIATPVPASTADPLAPYLAEWPAVQEVLSRHTPVRTTPPTSVVTDRISDGMLLGNGDTAVAVGGTPASQTSYITKSDFWTDGTYATGDLPRHVTVGGVTVDTAAFAGATYRQELDLATGIVTSTFVQGAATLTMKSWVSAVTDSVIVRLELTGIGSAAVSVKTWAKSGSAKMPTSAGADAALTWAGRSTWAGVGSRWVSRAALATKVIGASTTNTSDSVDDATASFTLTEGTPVTVATAVTGARDETGSTTDVATVAAAKADATSFTTASVDATRGDHLDWWRDFWLKSWISIDEPMVQQYWYGSTYLLGASTREGATASGLWGPWITTDNPAWGSDYHLNYNFEAPNYGLASSNRHEFMNPYFTAITDYVPSGRTQAETLFGEAGHGVYFPVGIAPGGITEYSTYHGQRSNAALAAVPFLDYYRSTHDEEWLSTVGYPYVKEVAQFWVKSLGAKNAAGTYDVTDSACYESAPNTAYPKTNSIIDLSILKTLFPTVIEMSEDAGLDSNLRATWQEIADSLSDFGQGNQSTRSVFLPCSDWNVSHTGLPVGGNPISVWASWPSTVIGNSSPPERRATQMDTIYLQNSWSHANGFAEIFSSATRVGYGADNVLSRFASRVVGLRANQTIDLSVAGGLETIAPISAVNDMLMQSHDGDITVFPQWPTDRSAEFHRLRAYGAFLVSSAYANGNVSYIDVTSEKGKTASVVSPWLAGSAAVIDQTTGLPVDTTVVGQKLTFDTETGHTYRIAPSAAITAVDITERATVTAGSVAGAGYESDKAVDGRLGVNLGWKSSTLSGRWLQFDFGTDATVSRWVVKHAADGGEAPWLNTRDFTLQWSADGSTWSAVDSVTDNVSSVTNRPVAATTARYFRIDVSTANQTVDTPANPNDTALDTIARIQEIELYGQVASAPATPTNLARGKMAASDSDFSTGTVAAKAVDGASANANTDKWASTRTAGDHWLSVDLGGTYPINRWVVKHASTMGETSTFNTKNFRLQVKDVGGVWQDVDTVTNNVAAITDRSFAPVMARHVRLYITTPAQTSELAARIGELEVYGTAPRLTNVALGKPATASTSYNNGQSGERAVDGYESLVSDKWISERIAATHQLEVDLGTTYEISRWVVKHAGWLGETGTLNTRDFSLQVSVDGEQWDTPDAVVSNISGITDRTFSAVTARYVRLVITKPAQSTELAARVAELEIYGT